MRMTWLVCVFMGTLAWGQAAPSTPPPQPTQPSPMIERPQSTAPATAESIPADAAVITVEGVCSSAANPAASSAARSASEKASSDDCKTVITKAEFEKIMAGVPNPTPQVRKQVASALPRLIVMSEAARKRGLDKTPEYKEMVKVQSMNILAQSLTRKIQEEASDVPAGEVENYYKQNSQSFEQFSLERLFVPRNKQPEAEAKDDDDEKLSDDQKKAKQQAEKEKTEQGEQAMSKLADDLRARAAAGEDFAKLQKDAFEAAGMKIESPTVTLPKVRRSGLPPAHGSVFDMKVGDVSSVFNDAGGHYIYKLTAKDQLSLDQAKEEIHGKLQADRSREAMEKLNSSYKVETNEAYFGPGGSGMTPPPRGPGAMAPRMQPGPTPPAAGAQTAPATPTAKPN